MQSRVDQPTLVPARLALVALIALLSLGPLAEQAAASHFRSGNLSWQRTGTGNDVSFNHVQAWRRTTFAGSGEDGYPVAGDIVTNDEGCIDFGDDSSLCPQYRVTFANVAEDYVVVRPIAPETQDDPFVPHGYPGSGPFTAITRSCCTISDLLNAPDSGWNVSALVDLARDDESPRSTVPPVVNLPSGGVQRFTIPATDPGGETIRYRLSTPLESCVEGCQEPQPPGLAIDSATGVVSWDTTGRDGLWWTGVVIEAVNGQGDVLSSTQIQYIIRVGGSGNNSSPEWAAPTPVDSTTFVLEPGQILTLQLAAVDPDVTDVVQVLQSSGPGATTTTDGNPATATYSFTATEADLDREHIVQFLAQDNGSPPLGPPFRSFKIRVARNVPAPPPPPSDPPPVPSSDPPPTIAGPSTTPAGEPEAQATLALAGTSSDLFGDTHRVQATAARGGAPLASAQLRWRVEGASSVAGAATTAADGRATIAWKGTRPGRDTLTAFADLNGNGTRDASEPEATHVVDWLKPPTVGKTANVEPVSGEVFVKLPRGANPKAYKLGAAQANGFIPLKGASTVPLGSTFDTTQGRVNLQTAVGKSRRNATQTANFWNGQFVVRQVGGSSKPITEMRMAGALSCSQRRNRLTAAQRAKKRRSRVLWGNGKGRFRTRGRNSSATVRGTMWLVKDTCTATETRVRSGRVVVRDFAKRRNVTIKAGQKYVARPAKKRKRSTKR